jgi:hypothetical protein
MLAVTGLLGPTGSAITEAPSDRREGGEVMGIRGKVGVKLLFLNGPELGRAAWDPANSFLQTDCISGPPAGDDCVHPPLGT